MPKARMYAFIVTDKEGLWGGIRCKATTEAGARKLCTRELRSEVTKGSLHPRFKLKR